MALNSQKGNSNATSSAIKAGEAYFELNVSDTKAGRVIASFANRIKGLGQSLQRVGAGVAGIGGLVLTPLIGFFTAAVEHANNVDSLATKLQASAEAVSSLTYATKQAGVELNDFVAGMLKLNAAALNAEKGSIDQAVAFEQMGVSARKFIGLDLDAKVSAIAGTFDKMQDPMSRAQFLFRLFGEDTNKLLPFFLKGKAGIEELTAKAKELGITLNSEDAKKGAALHAGFAKILGGLKRIFLEIGFAMFGFNGSIEEGIGVISNAVNKVRIFIQENAGLIRIIALVSAGLIAGGFAITAFGTVLTSTITILAAVKAAVFGLVALAFSPLILKIGLLIGLFYAFAKPVRDFQTILGEVKQFFVQAFTDMFAVFREMFEGITAALRSGNFQLAFKIFTKGIETVWAMMTLNLRKGWNGVMEWMIDSLKKNPWILPLLTSLAGAAVGGPAGAAAGALIGLAGAGAIEMFEKEIKAALSAPIDEAQAKVDRLKGELSELVNQAKAEEKAKMATAKAEDIDRPDLRYKRELERLGDAVRGTFQSGDYRGTLGIGPANEIAKKQYEVQKQIRDELMKLNKKPGLAFE